MKVLILINYSGGLYHQRYELIQEMLSAGHEVYFSTPDEEKVPELIKMGCKYEPCAYDRHGVNPFEELLVISRYKKILRRVCPDVVLTYSIKPNVYGGMACAAMGIPYAVNITGRGTAVNGGGLLQKITLFLYRRGLRKAKMVFFQNSDDLAFMQRAGVVRGSYVLLPGSGVNLERNILEPYPEDDGMERFLFIGRLCEAKGVRELVEAAKYICGKYDNVRFAAVGFCEPDYQAELEKLQADKFISLEGLQDNVHEWIKRSTAVVHPSHLEGMSNVLLEAAASGRPVIATDIPGCRETFDEGVSGLGFQPQDVSSFCEALERFIALPYEAKVEMGRAGQRKVEKKFDRQIIVDKYMELLKQIEWGKET